MAEIIPAGRLAPGAWCVSDLGAGGIDVGWCETGDVSGYRSCAAFVDRASALAAMAAMEAAAVPSARDTLLEAGFAREEPKGLHAGPAPNVLRRDGYAVAWLAYDGLTASVSVAGRSPDAPVEVAAIAPPSRRPGETCSLTQGRDAIDLCIAGAVAAWRAHAASRAVAASPLDSGIAAV